MSPFCRRGEADFLDLTTTHDFILGPRLSGVALGEPEAGPPESIWRAEAKGRMVDCDCSCCWMGGGLSAAGLGATTVGTLSLGIFASTTFSSSVGDCNYPPRPHEFHSHSNYHCGRRGNSPFEGALLHADLNLQSSVIHRSLNNGQNFRWVQEFNFDYFAGLTFSVTQV